LLVAVQMCLNMEKLSVLHIFLVSDAMKIFRRIKVHWRIFKLEFLVRSQKTHKTRNCVTLCLNISFFFANQRKDAQKNVFKAPEHS
jgi:hypothetical protein